MTKEFIEASNGAYLHRFGWLDDYFIGELPYKFNHLPLEMPKCPKAKIVHYSVFGPYHYGHSQIEHGPEWWREHFQMTRIDQE